MDLQKKSRFKDLPWFNQIIRLNDDFRGYVSPMVVGVGGIGSWLSIALVRAGLEFNMTDFDIIEEHNLGGQAFFEHHLGMAKISAVNEVCNMFASGVHINAWEENITEGGLSIPNIFFVCPDNMAARKYCFNAWLIHTKMDTDDRQKMAIYIDGRMLAEDGEIYAVRFTDLHAIEAYTATLFDDAEVKDQACTAKATSHCGMMMGSMMASVFFNHLTNLAMGMEIREVPFKTQFHLQLLDFRIELVDRTKETQTIDKLIDRTTFEKKPGLATDDIYGNLWTEDIGDEGDSEDAGEDDNELSDETFESGPVEAAS